LIPRDHNGVKKFVIHEVIGFVLVHLLKIALSSMHSSVTTLFSVLIVEVFVFKQANNPNHD